MNRAKAKSKPTRAVGYVRISVDRDDETSTTTQEERVRAYCVAHGWDVVDVIVEPGRSAYKTSRSSRPGFRRVMGLIGSGAADVLVVWKLDRAARDTVDTLGLVRELGECGAQFVSVTEGFDTSSASGRMMVTILAALAEMESATKSERVQAWQDHRRANGSTPTGPRPFGYQRGGPDNPNVLTVDIAEAAVIRQAAARVLAGESLRSIVRSLETAGVVGKSGKPISHRALRAILLGPTIAALREVEPDVFVGSDTWGPILDRDTWDRLRAYLTDPSRRTNTGNARRWMLSGIATCGRGCLDERGEPIRLWCKPHKEGGPRYFCRQCYVSIEVARTDEVVERDLLSMLDPKAWRLLRQGRSIGAAPGSTGFEKAMTELTARFVAGDIDATELASVAEELRRQQELASTPAVPLPDVPDLAKAWPKLTLEQRRVVLSAATEGLSIKPWTPGSTSFDEKRIVWTPVP